VLAADDGDRLQAVAGLGDDVEVVLGREDEPEAGADELLVVGDDDADRIGRGHADTAAPAGVRGSHAATRNPPAGRGPASSSPP
jgi:hypothetical protein